LRSVYIDSSPAIRWNACLRGACLCLGAHACRCRAVQCRAEAQKAPPPSRTAARGCRRPGDQEDGPRQADHETGIEESTRHSDRCHHGRDATVNYVQFQFRAAAAGTGSSFDANCSRRSIRLLPPVLLASHQSLSKVWFRNLKRPVGTRHYLKVT